jgi:hypothetical protein
METQQKDAQTWAMQRPGYAGDNGNSSKVDHITFLHESFIFLLNTCRTGFQLYNNTALLLNCTVYS